MLIATKTLPLEPRLIQSYFCPMDNHEIDSEYAA